MTLKNCMMLFLVLSYTGSWAQDFAKAIRGMRNEYDKSKSFEIVMDIVVYDSAQTTTPYYQEIIEIKRDGDNYAYQTGDNEMLLNDRYLIMVDKSAKQISYSQRDLNAEKALQQNFQFNLDSILRSYDNVKFIGTEGDADHFLIREKKGPIDEIHFFITRQGFVLRKMEYKYHAGQHVSLRFSRFDEKPIFHSETFSESKYMTNINNRMTPSRFFKTFQLNYQR